MGEALKEWDDKYWLRKAMTAYGGSFVKALAEAIAHADADNYRKLKSAFPEYWERYAERGANLKAKEAEQNDNKD